MCVEGCREVVESTLTRRGFLEAAGVAGSAVAAGATGAALVASCAAGPPAASGDREPAGAASGVGESRSRGLPPSPASAGGPHRGAGGFPGFSSILDLTHTYSSLFPHFRGDDSRVDLETVLSTERGDGWNMKLWTLDEHSGTHVDAPIHRAAGGLTVDRIPALDLVLPLVVVDLREKARRSADAVLTPGDLRAWEAAHGPLPPRACVALWSGWDARVGTPGFLGIDAGGVRHFPGFHIEAIELLLEERDVVAIATDAPSFDPGNTAEFPAHTRWLGSGRWALENAAALGEAPVVGATLVCGAPKIAGATGGPSRVFALV